VFDAAAACEASDARVCLRGFEPFRRKWHSFRCLMRDARKKIIGYNEHGHFDWMVIDSSALIAFLLRA